MFTGDEKFCVVVENENQNLICDTRKADVSVAATTVVNVGKRTPKKTSPAVNRSKNIAPVVNRPKRIAPAVNHNHPLIIVTNFSPATSLPCAKTDALNNVITIENSRMPDKIKHVCIHCSKAFPSKTAIETHFKNVHGNVISRQIKGLVKKDASDSKGIAVIDTKRRIRTQFVCSFCSKKFRSKVSMEKHVIEMHSTSTSTSTTSENIDKSKPAADIEVQPEHSKIADEAAKSNDQNEAAKSNDRDDASHYICANCGQKFPSKVKLNRHLKRYSKEYAQMCVCDVCDKKFTTPYSMRNHRKLNHENPFVEDDFWKANVPATASNSAAEDKLKSMEVMVDGKRIFQCDQCAYKCPVRNRFRMHYRIHSGERPYFCEKCGKQFNSYTLLRNHLAGVHEGIRKFPCDICGKKFASKHYADEHRRIHTGEKPFVCDLCGSAFTHLTSLLTHKNRHDTVPRFKCPWCPQSFVYPGGLALHKKRHTGDLSHKCNECGKAFIDKQHLKRHLAVHSDDRPFTCNICGATFKLSKYLGSHKKTHRNERKSSAALEGEKWDPLILPPHQQTAAGATAANAEDRAKLVKSKKLGPLMRSYEGNDVIVLECDQCTAFFIDKNDYDKHRKSHENHTVGECAVDASFISVCGDFDDDVHLKTIDDTESAAKIRSKKKSSSNSPSKAVSPKGWRNSSRQKLRIKLGGNVVVKKTAKKVNTGTGRSSLSKDDSISARGLSSSPSSQRRQSTKNVSYTEFDDSDGENDRKNVKRVLPDEFESRITKRGKDAKKRKCSEPVAFEMDSSEDEVKPGRGDDIIEVIEEMIIADRTPSKKNTRERRSTSDGEVRRKKPRLKRLRRGNDEDDDKGQTIYTCAHCLRKFRRKSNLKRHMSKLHFGKEKDDASDGSKWFTGYCCDICGEGLQVRSMMMAHRDVMHGRYPEIDWCKYQTSLARVKFCNECKKYFRGGKLFDEHICDKGKGIVDEERARLMKEAEDIKPSFFCYICNHCFKWKWDYRAHHENEHKEAPSIDWSSLNPLKLEFYCDKCCKAYAEEMVLNSHECTAAAQQVASDMAVKPFRCELCGSDYFWKSDFRRHMRTKHPKENYRPTEHDTIIYSCPYCEEKFSMKKRILHHMRKAHNINSDSPFVCVQCNKVFRRRDNLDRHNESYHPTLNDQEANKILSGAEIKINGEIAYHCEVCNRNMSNPNRFISHYRGHYSENKFTCDLCGKQAKTQHQLNTHIKNIHLNIRNYKCDICSKSFYTKQACEEHRRIHTGERPFSCEICGKTFVAGNALISHKRFHNDFYPHSCHMCPKKFKVRRSLINHIRTHTGERPFKCDLCTKTFNNSSQYSYHKKVTHSEARPFVCSLCGNCFKANKFLTRHMELHAIRTQIQTRKPNNPAHYTTSQIKTSPATTPSAAQPVASTTIAANHQQQQPVPQQHPPLPPQPANRVSVVEHTVSSAPIMTAQVQPVQHVNSGGAVYVKEVSPSTSTTYRNDDLVAAAMYNLQRTGYENNTNEFARPVVAPAGCDINTMNGNKRNFTAADAYVTAASYTLGNEDFKTNPGTVARPYNPPGQPPGNHSIATGKHMTWL